MPLRLLMQLVLFALLVAPFPGHAAPSLWVGSTNVLAGNTVWVSLQVLVDTNVPHLQFDLVYETNFLSSATPLAGPALADQIILSSEPSPGVRRVELFSFSNTPVTSGTLVFVPFTASSNAPGRYTGLVLTNIALTNVQQQLIPNFNVTNGTLEIMNPPRFTSVVRIPGAGLRVQAVSPPGHLLIIQVNSSLSQNLWTPLLTNQPPLGVTTFDDPSAVKLPARFYRAVLVP